jgi:AcrR family transcriptional regulator
MRTKTEERRQRILDVAIGVFRDVGYEKASMAEIASQVGGSKATLYNYFPSKAELFLAVMNAAAEQHFAPVFQQLSHDGPLRETLQRFGVRYLKTVLSDELVAIHRMASHEADRSEVGRLLYENGITVAWRQVGDFLRACVDRGEMPACDVHMAAVHLHALYEAELREPRMLGCLREAQVSALAEAAVARAVEVWACRYLPTTIAA